MVSSFVTTPIDVIKTRMMLSALDTGESLGKEDGRLAQQNDSSKGRNRLLKTGDKGMLEVGRDISHNEGVRGLFKGGIIRAGWTAISLSLYLSLYEGGRFYLENRRRALEGLRDEAG